jgi:hypothetical protein
MVVPRKIILRLALFVGLTVVVTLAVLAYCQLSTPQPVALAVPSATAARISFFALGDQGTAQFDQWRVARSMENVAEKTGDLDFVILLGDNFYRDGIQSTEDRQWNWKFENMYSGTKLATIPFYSVLGNNDVRGNGEAQIQYSRDQAGSGRWQMPGHYYSKDFGLDNGHPLLRVVFVDSNNLTPENMAKQVRFIAEAFAPSATQATWRIVVAHHPIRNAGHHGETEAWYRPCCRCCKNTMSISTWRATITISNSSSAMANPTMSFPEVAARASIWFQRDRKACCLGSRNTVSRELSSTRPGWPSISTMTMAKWQSGMLFAEAVRSPLPPA